MEPRREHYAALPQMMLESLPPAVLASIEVRDAWRRKAASAEEGLEFIVSDLARWPPGSVLQVAFLDGDAELHARIEQATGQITDACNLSLDFGRDPATGEYRRWRETDTAYRAHIRISFDRPGYWSLVGTDSTDQTVGAAGGPDGGRPGQRSLNLGGFADGLPPRWPGTVRHEFLHALAFQHAHQNMRGRARTNSAGKTTLDIFLRRTPTECSSPTGLDSGPESTPPWRAPRITGRAG